MRFTYTYRSSDGERHTAEIEAENRDAAFAKIRTELGIKPIKVKAADAPDESGRIATEEPRARAAVWRAVAMTAAIMALAGGGALWRLRRTADSAPYKVMTPQGPVTYTTATPLPRQMIPGSRARIRSALQNAFQTPAERLLARFAEPGRTADANEEARPTDEEFAACLRAPVRIASNDFTEVVDLKRIVTGMKREMRAYLAGGGTAQEYCAELAKRQKLETSYRENAEKRLAGMLQNPKEAYAFWLKANASLKSMGIYELPLPDALHGYQAGLDLDE